MPYPLKQEQEKEAWGYKLVDSLAKGVNLSVRDDQLEDQECLRASNVISLKGLLKVDTGYKQFASSILGIPQTTWQFDRSTGISELMLVTTLTVYAYSEALDQWQYVAGLGKTTTSAGASAGAVDISLTSATNFPVGVNIGITLDNGSQHQTSIFSKIGNTITISNAIPAGRSVASGAAVVRAVALNGDLDQQVVVATIPSHDWMVFTNGVDIVKRYDGVDCVDVPGLPMSVVCKTLALYNNSLFLINTIEAGTSHPRRVRRSDSADPATWTEGVGTAGVDDLLDAEDDILGSEVLGPYLILYAEREIIRGEFIGTGGLNYKFDTMVRGEGVIATNVVADVGDVHYVMCQSNIYAYRGGFDLEPIGDNIYYRIYGSRAEMSPQLKHRSFAFYVEELDEVWFFYPSTHAVAGCDRLVRYNVGEEVWTEREFPDEFVGLGFFQSKGSRSWLSLVGSWLQQSWKWNDRTLKTASPTTHLCPAISGQKVMEYDYVQALDNGQAIPYTVETKDFLAPDVLNRFDMLEMGIQGENILVEYSTDSGLSWGTFEVAKVGGNRVTSSEVKRVRVFRQFPFEKVRFRWSGASSFVLTWFGFSYGEESEA